MSNKKTILEEYYRIQVDIECVFLFFLNFKTNVKLPKDKNINKELEDSKLTNYKKKKTAITQQRDIKERYSQKNKSIAIVVEICQIVSDNAKN